jgi:tRNA A-37 threonylcarbamoyl transferase component Bud32
MNDTARIRPKCGATVPVDAPQGLCPKCVMAGAVATVSPARQAGAGFEPPPVEQVAAAFPQLEVVELIGAGGMGAVYKARQPKLERWVALKVLPESLGADPAFTERFSREARLLASLNHPNIVTVYDFGHSGGFFFLLMEYVDGVNLRDAMVAGRITPSQALGLVPKICEALQYAHEEGILHRDIKPENILLDVKGRVKIADFGIAKLLGARKDVTLTAAGAAVGTPHYMAPEQLEHPQEVDQRADIYSLGVVFYEMLTGELPMGRFAPPSEKSTVDPRVDPIVLRALERDRDKRFASASEVKTRVESLGSPPPPAHPLAGPATVPHAATADKAQWCRKAILAAVLSGLSLVVDVVAVPLLILAVFAVSQPGRGSIGIGWAELVFLLTGAVASAGFGLAGLILGLMARSEIRDSGDRLRGKGLATFAVWALPGVVLLVAGGGLLWLVMRHGLRTHFAFVFLVGGAALLLGLLFAGLMAIILGRRRTAGAAGGLGALGAIGVGLLLLVILPGALLLGYFTLFSARVVTTPGVSSQAGEPGLLLRQTHRHLEGDRATENKWLMSVAPGREMKVRVHVLSNNVPVLAEPLSASFTTPEPGDRVEGQFSVEMTDSASTRAGAAPWKITLSAPGTELSVLELSKPTTPPVEWNWIREFPRIEVAKKGGFSGTLIEGTQRLDPNPSGRTALWQARLDLFVDQMPVVVERRGARPNQPAENP